MNNLSKFWWQVPLQAMICSSYFFGYNGITQNQIFSFARMTFFPWFSI
jgi:hypothetical protein